MTKRYPYASTFVCFGYAVEGQEFSKRAISRWFKELVDPEDYDPNDRIALLRHFNKLTCPTGYKNGSRFAPHVRRGGHITKDV